MVRGFEIHRSKTERFGQILGILRGSRRPMAPYEIARALMLSEMYVFKLLKELENLNRVKRRYLTDPRTRRKITVFEEV